MAFGLVVCCWRDWLARGFARRLRDERALVEHLERARQHEAVGKHGEALAGAVAAAHERAPVADAVAWITALGQYIEQNDTALRERADLFATLCRLARRAGLDLKQLVAERFGVRRPDDMPECRRWHQGRAMAELRRAGKKACWFAAAALILGYVLTQTKIGNWIFAVGGNKEAARAVGVPANQVKVGLFVCVSMCGCLAGTLIALRYGTVQANQGTGLEFEYIIAAVVGGCLLTGGYGTAIGAAIGAFRAVGLRRDGWAFVLTAITIGSTVASVFAGLYPVEAVEMLAKIAREF